MNNPAVMKKLMLLESKMERIVEGILVTSTAISDLAKEQRIIRRKQNEILKAMEVE